MAKRRTEDVSIGKFDVLATYAYARALLDGSTEGEAKERGIVAAVMGAKARLGHGGGTPHADHDYKTRKDAAEKKKKSTITAESFDHQVSDKMGAFFGKDFSPAIKKLVAAGLSYDEVKRRLKVPATWGSKITGEQFRERASEALRKADLGE